MTDGSSLTVEIADGLPPQQLYIEGSLVTDPANDDGVVLVENGLIARVGLGGAVAPIAQDQRLTGGARLLDGQLVVESHGSYDCLEPPR